MWSIEWALNEMKPAIEDELQKCNKARTFVAVGEPDKVRERIEPIWQLGDSICVSPPTDALSPEKLQYYSDMIASTFAPDTL
jgi:alkanesulfonate monooxygenase SsuD/methylene tetrahydromethanopterin reductase-like flavin-dependent oxidoreductase (luciferase family)